MTSTGQFLLCLTLALVGLPRFVAWAILFAYIRSNAFLILALSAIWNMMSSQFVIFLHDNSTAAKHDHRKVLALSLYGLFLPIFTYRNMVFAVITGLPIEITFLLLLPLFQHNHVYMDSAACPPVFSCFNNATEVALNSTCGFRMCEEDEGQHDVFMYYVLPVIVSVLFVSSFASHLLEVFDVKFRIRNSGSSMTVSGDHHNHHKHESVAMIR